MSHNLTESQQDLARWLVAERKAGRLDEYFSVTTDAYGRAMFRDSARFPFSEEGARVLLLDCPSFTNAALDALAAEGMLLADGRDKSIRRFTFRRRLLDAVQNDFRDQPLTQQIQSVTAPHAPPELALSLGRLRQKYPDAAKLGFLVVPASSDQTGAAIVQALKGAAARHDLAIVSAAEQEFHANPWANVRTLLHGCSFGVAIYEYAGGAEPDVNAGIELGYLHALDKPVLLLRGRKVSPLQTDHMHNNCEGFDEEDPAHTIPELLDAWLRDNGVILSANAAGGQTNGSSQENR